jgi:hypothetical protein
MELELAALYDRRASKTRDQAKRMVNANVRDSMERLAAIWDKMAERALVSQVLDDVRKP